MRRLSVCMAFTGALAFSVAAVAQAPEPIVGSWKLDVAKSTYKPGPAPKSATIIVEAAGKGIKATVDVVGADGAAMKWGFTNPRDDKDFPITGNPAYDTGMTTQTSPREGTNTYKKAGKVLVTAKTRAA